MKSLLLFVSALFLVACSSDEGGNKKTPTITGPVVVPGPCTLGCGNTTPPDVEEPENPVDGTDPVVVTPEPTNPTVPGDQGEEEESPSTPPEDEEEDEETMLAVQQLPLSGRSHSYQVQLVVQNLSQTTIQKWSVSFVKPAHTEMITCWGSTSSTMNELNGMVTWKPDTEQYRVLNPGSSRTVTCQINLPYQANGYNLDQKDLKDLSVVIL